MAPATGINNAGDVVGYVSLTTGGPLSAAWNPTAGGSYDGHPIFTVGGAVVSAVNDNRVGAGVDIGGSRALPLVMVPDGAGPMPAYERSFVLDVSALVPEPTMAAPLLAMVGAALVRRTARQSHRRSQMNMDGHTLGTPSSCGSRTV
jgi:hypothetical protein